MHQIKQILVITAILLLVFICLENTQTTTIELFREVKVTAPLSLELLFAAGTGALLVWVSSVWNEVRTFISSQQTIKSRDRQIEELEATIKNLSQL